MTREEQRLAHLLIKAVERQAETLEKIEGHMGGIVGLFEMLDVSVNNGLVAVAHEIDLAS